MKRPSECVGEQLARARNRRGWSQQRLAEAIKEHAPESTLNRAAVAKIESGVRNVSIDELFLLAAAANVPPVLLVLPLGTDDDVELTPRSRIHPHLALEWVCGEEPLATTDRFVIRVDEWHEGAGPMHLYRLLREVQNAANEADAAIRSAEYARDEKRLRSARERRAGALTALHAHLRRMQQAAVRPPGQTAELLAEMAAVGLAVDGLPTWEPSAAEREQRAREDELDAADEARWKAQSAQGGR